MEMRTRFPVGGASSTKREKFLDSVALADKVKGVVEHIFNFVTGKLDRIFTRLKSMLRKTFRLPMASVTMIL